MAAVNISRYMTKYNCTVMVDNSQKALLTVGRARKTSASRETMTACNTMMDTGAPALLVR